MVCFTAPQTAFRSAFETLRRTTASGCYEPAAWPDDLLVTTDFAETVQARDQNLDWFLRPVHWLVSCQIGSSVAYIIVSPYETQELLPSIRRNRHVAMHVYSPRLSGSMRTLEQLSFCSIPAVPQWGLSPHLIRQLNLFAGQLYLQDFKEYKSFCGFLGLCSHPPGSHIKVACDGFISPASRAKLNCPVTQACRFTNSPVAFVKMIITFRRKGQTFASSHLGRILNGELIAREHL